MAMLAVFLLLCLTPMAKSELLGRFCGIQENWITISAYKAKLNLLSAALAKNASSSELLFSKGNVGSSGWQQNLYGLALCRGDTPVASACSECVTDAFVSAQQLCELNMDDVAMIYDRCLIRFSYYDFIDNNRYEVITYGVLVNTMNKTTNISTNKSSQLLPGWDPGNPTRYNMAINKLLQETIRTAVFRTKRSYQLGFMDATGTMPPLYSMAQCTPDLTPGDCMTCLQYIGDMAMTSFAGQQKGQVISLRCSLRYDTAPFDSTNNLWRVQPPADDVDQPAAASNLTHKKRRSKILVTAITIPLVVSLFVLISFGCIRKRRKVSENRYTRKVYDNRVRMMKANEDEELAWGLEGRNLEFRIYDFAQVIEATGNFSERNKLGKGGFGPVYKGTFPDGLEVAVKRLASRSVQGFTEFKNEIQLIAKLQHTNLVRLLGCCSHGEEKILIYEYLSNKSLDFFIFDPVRKYIINWIKRLAIIKGVAEGLLYLHKHSRLRVIHRDLKASNILLDRKMNPKISDFGLAKVFSTNESEGNTCRIAGTYGYMAPEYASEGIFSIKSDVFSFGVLILEVVSGKRTSSVHGYGDFINLLGHSWQLWKDGLWLKLVDASIDAECYTLEVMRCMNIALLCVQENAADRPTMSDVVQMLSSDSLILPEPKHPAYFHIRVTNEETTVVVPSSVNDVTVSALDGR